MKTKKFSYDYPRPAVTTDAVVFAFDDQHISVLLIKRGKEPFLNQWALPGGFVNMDETTEAAVERELFEETNLENIPLLQFRTYSDPDRDPRHRTISVVYAALIKTHQGIKHQAGDDASDAQWFTINALPSLAFDHDTIVYEATRFIVDQIKLHPEVFKSFTTKELNKVSESLLSLSVSTSKP